MGRLNVGVDWGHEHIQFVAEDEQAELLWKQRCASRELPEAIRQLRKMAADRAEPVSVVLERKSGRLVELLLGAGFDVWFVRPRQVDDARQLRFASHAKDDLRDARIMAWMVRVMPEALSRVDKPSVPYLDLQRTTRTRTGLVADRTAVLSQIIELFRERFPEMLQITTPANRWFTALWRLVSHPKGARPLSVDQVREVLRRFRVRKISAEEIGTLLAASEGSSLRGDWTLEADLALERLELLESQIGRLEARMGEQLAALHAQQQAEQPGPTDVEIVGSLPGAGERLTPMLLAERLHHLVSTDLPLTRTLCGVAPVLQTTGKRQTRGGGQVSMRRACNGHLRNALHLLIEKGIQADAWMKQRYATLRAKGQTHGRACRQMADGLLRRLHAMLRDRVLYQSPTIERTQTA